MTDITVLTTVQNDICQEVQEIMRVYREQQASDRGLGTPGGLEHMGDVWQMLSEWDARLSAVADDIGGIPEIDRAEPIPFLCRWTMDDSAEFWQTECGDRHILNDGTPRENGMRFCCYCGDKLIERTEPDTDTLREERNERRRLDREEPCHE